jgi:hypothetical protein
MSPKKLNVEGEYHLYEADEKLTILSHVQQYVSNMCHAKDFKIDLKISESWPFYLLKAHNFAGS